MVTTHKKITLGESHLQGLWSESVTANDARAYPDRRLSVCKSGCVTKEAKASPSANSVKEPGNRHDKGDSLLGSLLAETFAGAVFGPMLPLWAQAIEWSHVVEAADEIWLERREAAPKAPARAISPRFF